MLHSAPASPPGPAFTPSSTLEDPEEKNLERLEEEYQKLLNHSDCGVQCEAPPASSLAFADLGVQLRNLTARSRKRKLKAKRHKNLKSRDQLSEKKIPNDSKETKLRNIRKNSYISEVKTRKKATGQYLKHHQQSNDQSIAIRGESHTRNIATLPQRHDLDLDHPVHEDTVLVNAFVEELTARHIVWLVKLDGVGQVYFTRHGQHLSTRGKWLLADMTVRALASSVRDSSPLFLKGAPVAIPPSFGSLSSEVLGERACSLQPSPNQHTRTP
ncbi:hypothetical protein J6590_031508 [Homalodisca vitripennis]|nr:hypothetical protein J6590_031508 [Homalodisca vitripennis]